MRGSIVAGRVLLLLMAAVALTTALVLTRASRETDVAYRCPMHPQVTAAAPGRCPVCGMALVPARVPAPVASGIALPSGARLSPEDLATPFAMVVARELVAPAWLDGPGGAGLLYGDELAALAPGQRARFIPTLAPGRPLLVERTSETPVPHDDASWMVRLRLVDSPGPGTPTAGWLELPARAQPDRFVPYAAVLRGPGGPYLLVSSADGARLARRPVTLGRTFVGSVAVLSGLEEGERFVASNAALVDAELAPVEAQP